jgi:hypothetical protein
MKSLVTVPALVTLAVTLLRLAGELLGWSPTFFSRQAGGAGAVVGIIWLVPIFGGYFAWKLAQGGSAPRALPVIGHALLAFAVVVGSAVLAGAVLKLERGAQFVVIFLACCVAAWVAHRGWPTLGRTLLAYGLAARVPVLLVMLVAILGNWGTHYDVSPPNFPERGGPLAKWFFIGVLPQLFLWVPITIFLGVLFGGFVLLFTGRGRQPASA